MNTAKAYGEHTVKAYEEQTESLSRAYLYYEAIGSVIVTEAADVAGALFCLQ